MAIKRVFLGFSYRIQVTLLDPNDANPTFVVQQLKNHYDKNTPYWRGRLLYQGQDFDHAWYWVLLNVPDAIMPKRFLRYDYRQMSH